jgi:hypothetical protein
MSDRSEDATLREVTTLPERQLIQIDLVEKAFVELAQAHENAKTNFEAAHKLMLLGEHFAAVRCFEDSMFYLQVLSRRYDHLGSSIRSLREYSLCVADNQERKAKNEK